MVQAGLFSNTGLSASTFSKVIALKLSDKRSRKLLKELLVNEQCTTKLLIDFAVSLGEQRVLHIPHVLFHNNSVLAQN